MSRPAGQQCLEQCDPVFVAVLGGAILEGGAARRPCMHGTGTRPVRHDDRSSEAQRLDALSRDVGPRCQVDAHVGMSEQPPQVHPCVDRHLAAERPPFPCRGHCILEDHDIGSMEGRAEPGRRRRWLLVVAGAVTEDEQIVGESEAMVAVLLSQPVDGHVDPDRVVASNEWKSLPRWIGRSNGVRQEPDGLRIKRGRAESPTSAVRSSTMTVVSVERPSRPLQRPEDPQSFQVEGAVGRVAP